MVSIRASANLDILGVKFDRKHTFQDHVRAIVSHVSQSIGILRLVTRIFVDTSVLLRCYFAFILPILEYWSPVWGSAAECHLHLVEGQVCSVARLYPDQCFLSLCPLEFEESRYRTFQFVRCFLCRPGKAFLVASLSCIFFSFPRRRCLWGC